MGKLDVAQMDEKDTKKLVDLMWETMAYAHERRGDIKSIVKMIKD